MLAKDFRKTSWLVRAASTEHSQEDSEPLSMAKRSCSVFFLNRNENFGGRQ
jgi:hypothetical protein